MATKDQYLKGRQHDLALKDSTDIYRNFILNKNQKCTKAFDHKSSKNAENGKRKCYGIAVLTKLLVVVTEKTTSQKCNISLKKSHKNLSKNYFNTNFNDAKKEEKETWNNLSTNKCHSSSTLSLHIAAYENFIEAQDSDSFAKKEFQNKDSKTITVSKNVKHSPGLSFNDQLEFPRQQQENHSSTPEVQQFSTSQKLFSPIQESVVTQPMISQILGAMLGKVDKKPNMSIKDKLNIVPLFDKVVDLESCGLDETFNEYCFDISLTAKKLDENKFVIILKVNPQEGTNYELIVDYFLMIDDQCYAKEKDFWGKKEVLVNANVTESKVRICFGISVQQALSAENLTEKTSLRYYRILCSGTTFFVNPTYLKKLECSLFTKWYNEEVTHESCSIVQELTEEELAILLNACCGYSSIVIHSRNVYEIGEIALQFRIVGVIRAIDAYVRNLKLMHPVRKLEMALSFRLTQVADEIIRENKNSMLRLTLLHEYLKENDEDLCDMHPDVLKMLEIFDDYMVI